jgi:hypothetical protein
MTLRSNSGENSDKPGIEIFTFAWVDRNNQRLPFEFRSIPSSGEISGEPRGFRSVSFEVFMFYLVPIPLSNSIMQKKGLRIRSL